MSRLRRRAAGRIAAILGVVAASLMVMRGAAAQTTVTQDGPCAFTIVVPIEVYGPLATPELMARWKKNIEDRFNGPTEEMINEIADRSNVWKRDDLQYDRDDLNKRYQDFLKSIGSDGRCTEVNCCSICLRVDIRVREPGKPDPKYHQIEPVPEGLVRSYVRWGGPQSVYQGGVSGQWEVVSDAWAPEAHEVGHLLGLDDRYSDKHDDQGNVTGSDPHAGHENDLMARSAAWPKGSAFAEILKLAGFELPNCCREPDTVAQVTNMAIRYAGDMIAGCNRDGIEQSIRELRAQRANIIKDNFALPVKFQLIDSINARLRGLDRALQDCPPPTEGLTITSGLDGGQWCTYGDGVGQPTIAIPTNPNGVPISPGGPVTSGPPGGPPVKPTSGPPYYHPPGYGYPPPRHRYPGRKPPTADPPSAKPPSAGLVFRARPRTAAGLDPASRLDHGSAQAAALTG
jgi:hypothetical protein